MQIHHDVNLAEYSTMRLGGKARALTQIHTKDDLLAALTWTKRQNLPFLVLGGGSNVIFSDGYDGLVIIDRLLGFEVLQQDTTGATIRVGAGENWDDIVARTVSMGLSGLEKLSFIPGTAGATPVQNVGAYGAEIADVFVELEAYDLQKEQFTTLNKAACQFSYRNSIFKSPANRRYIITSVTLRLSTEPPKPPFYDALQTYLDQHNIHEYTAQAIRDAVIAIRKVKLPDPEVIANTGSFFKNPIIPAELFKTLQATHPTMPHWPMPDGRIKVSAGWLIDQAELKGYRAHGMEIYEHNALVFINQSAKTYNDLAAFKAEVIAKVTQQFGITLEQEPELL